MSNLQTYYHFKLDFQQDRRWNAEKPSATLDP